MGIRGLGGTVVVPPSIRPAGRHAGKAYTFAKRPWDDVVRLPTVKRQVFMVRRTPLKPRG